MDESPVELLTPVRGRSPYVAALLAWLVPGLGQVFAGRPAKGALYFAAIAGTFLLGWWLTDFTAVDPNHYPLDFAAQVFAGGPTFLALETARGHVLASLPKWLEVGRLYVLVAGLLNLVAVTDAVGESITRSRRAIAWREEMRIREARAAAAAREEVEA